MTHVFKNNFPVGRAGDDVFAAIDTLVKSKPAQNATAYLGCGDEAKAKLCPLNGPWKLLFTTAADASFSANSSRGAAQPMNIVDARRGRYALFLLPLLSTFNFWAWVPRSL